MRRFSISIYKCYSIFKGVSPGHTIHKGRFFHLLCVGYNHYLSNKFSFYEYCSLNLINPLSYYSRKFDKPAVKQNDGTCFWYLDNKRHRVGKPARIYSDGSVAYWENGKKSRMKKFSVRISDILDILDINYNHYLSDKFIDEEGCFYYFKSLYPTGYSSRKFDKPAIKRRDGTCCWLLDGKRHRIGKPTWIWSNGCEYWEDGERVK